MEISGISATPAHIQSDNRAPEPAQEQNSREVQAQPAETAPNVSEDSNVGQFIDVVA